MKKITLLFITLISFLGCVEPLEEFPDKALNDTMISLTGEEIMFRDILKKHEGKQIIIDAWASWCGDCIKGMPKLKALQKQFPDAAFVFLSADRSLDRLKRAINKYQVSGDHYLMSKGIKSDFGKSISLSWIPRYMVVNSQGNIKLFKSVKADDDKLIQALQ